MLRRRALNAGTLGGLAAILLWSTTVALARSLSEQLGPLSAAAAVYLVGGLAALIRLAHPGGRQRAWRQLPWRYVLGCGALFVLYMLVLFLGVGRAATRAQAQEVALLNYLWPALTILFSLLILDKRAHWLLVPGTLVGLTGVFLVLTQEATVSWSSFTRNLAGNPTVYALGLAAAVTWALYSNLTRRWAGDSDVGGVELFLPVTGLVLFSLSRLAGESPLWTRQAAVEAVFLGLVTWFAYGLWDRAMRQGDVVLVAAFSYLTPLFSTIVSSLYLAIRPKPVLWWGCVCIIVGSMVSWRSVSERGGGPDSAETPSLTPNPEEKLPATPD